MAEGPRTFSMFSKAPAAWAAESEPLGEAAPVDDTERAFRSVVLSISGEVILCNPGANWVGVDEG